MFWQYVVNAQTVGFDALVYLDFERRCERTDGAQVWHARTRIA